MEPWRHQMGHQRNSYTLTSWQYLTIRVSTPSVDTHFCFSFIDKRLQMLDQEDEEDVVEDNFDNFRKQYQPILAEHFADVMQIRDGKFYIDESD